MKTRRLIVQVIAVSWAALSTMCLSPAFAGTWTYPGEIPLAQAYNEIYFTSYDTTTTEGLATLVADHGTAMQSTWTTATVKTVTVLAMETSSTAKVGILVNGTTFLLLKDPGPWTSPTRGWLNDPMNSVDWAAGIVDISALLTGNGFAANSPFSFVVGDVNGVVMDETNTYRLDNNNTNSGFLLGYNETGLTGGDGDANEPIVYVNPSQSLPGTCNGQTPTIVGTPDRDIITIPEDQGPQVVMALGGNDVIYGSSGDDVICGGDGADIIYGKDGNDTIYGESGSDRIMGGNGDDTISGGDGTDTLEGDAGDDHIYGDASADTLLGNDGNDDLHGGDGNDTIKGGAGDDQLYGDAGDDQLVGDDGNDQLDGGDGNDKLVGGSGDDTMQGGAGDDSIYGQDGNDTVDGGDGNDVCDGGYAYIDAATNCETATNFETLF